MSCLMQYAISFYVAYSRLSTRISRGIISGVERLDASTFPRFYMSIG